MAPTFQVLPPKFRQLYQPIQDLKVYDDDVWLVTFPESGTHWMRETLCSILHGTDFDKLRSRDYKRSINIEFGCFESLENQSQLELSNLSLYHDTLERPRVMTTHLCWQHLPKALRDPNCKAKIVYVAKHPKDVCVSLYYHYLMVHGKEFKETAKSLLQFVDEFISGKIVFCPYWAHVYEFWARRNHPKIMCVLYEEMETDFSKVLARLQKFLNLDPLTADQRQELTKYLALEKMKETPGSSKEGITSQAFFEETNANVGEEAISMKKEKVDERVSYITDQITPQILDTFDNFIFANSGMEGYEDFEEHSFCKL